MCLSASMQYSVMYRLIIIKSAVVTCNQTNPKPPNLKFQTPCEKVIAMLLINVSKILPEIFQFFAV